MFTSFCVNGAQVLQGWTVLQVSDEVVLAGFVCRAGAGAGTPRRAPPRPGAADVASLSRRVAPRHLVPSYATPASRSVAL